MRTSFALQQQQLYTPTTTTTSSPTAISPSTATAAGATPLRSPWHSPIPYLFGGLAAMLGLIAFALLILACSYWKLSRDGDENGDLEQGKSAEGEFRASPVFEEKILVIMAGNNNPTYLATPRLSRAAVLAAAEKNETVQFEEQEPEKTIGEEEEGGKEEDPDQSRDDREQAESGNDHRTAADTN